MTTHHIAIPTSTSQALTFLYDKEKKRFSTTTYNAIQTQNRVSLQELEQFLEQANIPMKQWLDQFGWFMDPSCKFFTIAITCLIIFPLFLPFVIWHVFAKDKAEKRYKEAVENSKFFIEENNKHFIERGLMWKTPLEYPKWIELQTNAPGAKYNVSDVPTGIPI